MIAVKGRVIDSSGHSAQIVLAVEPVYVLHRLLICMHVCVPMSLHVHRHGQRPVALCVSRSRNLSRRETVFNWKISIFVETCTFVNFS